MKKLISLILSSVLIFSLTACSAKPAAGWQEQYDIGLKYVNEVRYEEAVLAFTKAITIDPKQPQSYISLAQVYIAQDMPVQAQAVLDTGYVATDSNKEIKNAYRELNLAIPDETEKIDRPDGGYTIYSYDKDGNILLMVEYSRDGKAVRYIVNFYNEEGLRTGRNYYDENGVLIEEETVSYTYYDNGEIKNRITQLYSIEDNTNGLFIVNYDQDGEIFWKNNTCPMVYKISFIENETGVPFSFRCEDDDGSYDILEFSMDGEYLKESSYNANGRLSTISNYEYDENGHLSRTTFHNADGTMYGYTLYETDENGNITSSQWYNAA